MGMSHTMFGVLEKTLIVLIMIGFPIAIIRAFHPKMPPDLKSEFRIEP